MWNEPEYLLQSWFCGCSGGGGGSGGFSGDSDEGTEGGWINSHRIYLADHI